jgi:hypothetical protein
MSTITDTATAVETVIKDASPYEPMLAGFLEMIPGIGIPIAVIQPYMPTLMAFAVRGLDDIAKGNGGDIPAAIIEWLQHNKVGQPNSPILSAATADPSTQGSG